MFMTGCVVVFVMSSCHDKDTDVLVYVKVSYHHICIKNVITERKTHKHA